MEDLNKIQAPSLSWEWRKVRVTRPFWAHWSTSASAVPHSLGISVRISFVLQIWGRENKKKSIRDWDSQVCTRCRCYLAANSKWERANWITRLQQVWVAAGPRWRKRVADPITKGSPSTQSCTRRAQRPPNSLLYANLWRLDARKTSRRCAT